MRQESIANNNYQNSEAPSQVDQSPSYHVPPLVFGEQSSINLDLDENDLCKIRLWSQINDNLYYSSLQDENFQKNYYESIHDINKGKGPHNNNNNENPINCLFFLEYKTWIDAENAYNFIKEHFEHDLYPRYLEFNTDKTNNTGEVAFKLAYNAAQIQINGACNQKFDNSNNNCCDRNRQVSTENLTNQFGNMNLSNNSGHIHRYHLSHSVSSNNTIQKRASNHNSLGNQTHSTPQNRSRNVSATYHQRYSAAHQIEIDQNSTPIMINQQNSLVNSNYANIIHGNNHLVNNDNFDVGLALQNMSMFPAPFLTDRFPNISPNYPNHHNQVDRATVYVGTNRTCSNFENANNNLMYQNSHDDNYHNNNNFNQYNHSSDLVSTNHNFDNQTDYSILSNRSSNYPQSTDNFPSNQSSHRSWLVGSQRFHNNANLFDPTSNPSLDEICSPMPIAYQATPLATNGNYVANQIAYGTQQSMAQYSNAQYNQLLSKVQPVSSQYNQFFVDNNGIGDGPHQNINNNNSNNRSFMMNCHNPSTTYHLINSATSCNNNITNINPYVNHTSNNGSQNNTQRLFLGQGDRNYPFSVSNLAGANNASNFGHTGRVAIKGTAHGFFDFCLGYQVATLGPF